MNIGTFKKAANGAFIGKITTLDLNVRVELRRVISNNPQAPVYEVMGTRDRVNYVKLGAVWSKTAKTTGEVFYVGSLNDPSMQKELRIALFNISKGEDAGGMAIVWDNGSNRTEATAEEPAPKAQQDDGLGESTTGQDEYQYS
jgi:uncharacterized protein (DUF736 family)